MLTQDTIARYRANRQDEINSAAIYRTLAALESQAQLAQVYERLAMVEERHAQFGSGTAGGWGVRATATAQLARAWTHLVGETPWAAVGLADDGHVRARGRHMYDRQPEAQNTYAARRRALPRTPPGSHCWQDGIEGNALARFEGRHRAIGGNALRAAVLGANDGLVSNFSLVMGVAGAELAGQGDLITGLAGCSPAPAPWRWGSGSRCRVPANSTSVSSPSRPRRSTRSRRRSSRNWP